VRFLIASTVLLALVMSCGGSDPSGPTGQSAYSLATFDVGTIAVHVHWGAQGIPGKQVDILELKTSKLTNSDGNAVFRARVGTYTVRVHDINRGGPSLLWVDMKATVATGEQTIVDVTDCLPCD